MRKGHVVYAHDVIWEPGKTLGSPLPTQFEILEDFPAPDSPGGYAHRFVAVFDREQDRNNILRAMQLGGVCSHNKKSWVRSITRIGDIEYQCSLCKGIFNVTADNVPPHYDEKHGTWHPPSMPPMERRYKLAAPEKLIVARKMGCPYCVTHQSARSCPAHGWVEKGNATLADIRQKEEKKRYCPVCGGGYGKKNGKVTSHVVYEGKYCQPPCLGTCPGTGQDAVEKFEITHEEIVARVKKSEDYQPGQIIWLKRGNKTPIKCTVMQTTKRSVKLEEKGWISRTEIERRITKEVD